MNLNDCWRHILAIIFYAPLPADNRQESMSV
jgi:hypothetical protein